MIQIVDQENPISQTSHRERERHNMEDEFCECRPLGFVIGLPFAVLSLLFCPVGALIWLIGSILSCLCPRCICFAEMTKVGMSYVKLPIRVHKWFIRQIPC